MANDFNVAAFQPAAKQARELHCSTADPLRGLVIRGKLRLPNTVALRQMPGSRNTNTGTSTTKESGDCAEPNTRANRQSAIVERRVAPA